MLSDNNIDNIYLIEGKDSALLIDTGIGAAALLPEDVYSGRTYNTRLLPLEEGQIFNLGGRFIKVMETPGHTPGEICLLDIGNKLLFTGDNNNSLVWLFLEGCTPLSKYLITLEKQAERMSEFDIIFPGHGPEIKSDFLLDQISCVKAILNGTCEVKDYKSFAGDSKICTYGRASVAFNPENL